MAFCAEGVAIFAAALAGQDADWQVVRADDRSRNQRTDTNDLLRDLLSRGGANGRIVVKNQTMGGEPAVTKDKSLRVFARNRSNQAREFDYDEDGTPRRVRLDTMAGGEGYDRKELNIVRSFYGVQGRTANLTALRYRSPDDGPDSWAY